MYISGYNRTLALLFNLGVAQTQGTWRSHPVRGPIGPKDIKVSPSPKALSAQGLWWDLHVQGSEPTQVKKSGKVP